MSKNILVFCSKPGDNILGAGGTLAKYASEGMKVTTVIFSYGEMNNPLLKRRSMKKEKEKQALEADKILNGKGVKFLNVKYGKMSSASEDPKFRKKVKALITKIKPEKIFTHSNQDHSPEARTVNMFIKDLVSDTKIEVYTFEAWAHVKKQPRMFVDISETLERKVEALRCFNMKTFTKWSVYAKAVRNGLWSDTKFAEVFRREH